MKPIVISSVLNTNADFLYTFFIDSKLHTEITKGKAIINHKIGGKFTAWDGYIKGEIVSLEKNRRIIQKWRTTDFNTKDQDSILDIRIKEIGKSKSKLILKHSELPEGTEEEYKNGWKEFYIKPLKEFIKRQRSA
jgi:activator of HSP90 ATPase